MSKKSLVISTAIATILVWVAIGFLWLVTYSSNPLISSILCAVLAIFILAIYLDQMSDCTVHFIRKNSNATIPTKRDGDGCYDLYANITEDLIIPPHETKLVPTGICSVFSDKLRIAFRERGSNTKWGGIVMAGQIDSNYRGEYFVAIYNTNDINIVLTNRNLVNIQTNHYTPDVNREDEILVPVRNKAICQFAIEPVPRICIQEEAINYLDKHDSERGTGKLGSSGK